MSMENTRVGHSNFRGGFERWSRYVSWFSFVICELNCTPRFTQNQRTELSRYCGRAICHDDGGFCGRMRRSSGDP